MTPVRPPRPSLTPARRGLTLIELAVALALTAMLVGMALPGFGAMVERHRLRSAAEDLAADLAEARDEAARRGSAVHVEFRTGDQWCYALALQPGSGCDGAQRLKTVRATEYPGLSLVDAQALVLDAGGASALSASGSVRFASRNGDQLRVRLTPLGRAALCAPAGRWTDVVAC